MSNRSSIPATMAHISVVRNILQHKVVNAINGRAETHDASKMESPEVEVFDEYTPKLAATTYGSDEYKGYLAAMKPALDHHYAKNRHHPEFFAYNPDANQFIASEVADGTAIGRMSLIDLIEMLCDWKAATLRHNDGDIRKSIEINQKRFGYGDELKRILLNTLEVIE